MSIRVLVLSGNSQVGAAAVPMLASRGASVRAAVRDLGKAGRLATSGAEIVKADLADTRSLVAALEGIHAVLLSTGVDRSMPELHRNLYQAAAAAGVRHVVRISAYGADPKSRLVLGRTHGVAERELEAAGIAWTHVRPHTFMQNLLGSAETIRQGKLYSCMGEGKVPHVHVDDIAEVAAVCLTAGGHEGKAYEVTGPEALSMAEVAARMSDALGRPIEYVDIPADAWVQALVSAGVPDWTAMDLAWLYTNVFARGHASKVSPTVKELTGREGRSIPDFARENAQLFGAARRSAG